MNKNQEDTFRKVQLVVQEVQGRNCLTNFHGMSMTSDKLRSLVKKWQSLIEAHVDVKTTDGYLIRVFTIAFTKRRPNQVRIITRINFTVLGSQNYIRTNCTNQGNS